MDVALPDGLSVETAADLRRGWAASGSGNGVILFPDGRVYRVEFHHGGRDPRELLREDAALSPTDLDALARRLERFDRASSVRPWTRETLELIAARPGAQPLSGSSSVSVCGPSSPPRPWPAARRSSIRGSSASETSTCRGFDPS